MKLYALESAEKAQACRQLIRLNNDCASLQWSRTIRDIPDDILNAMETVQSYAENRLASFCTEGTLIWSLSDEEESLWHECAKQSETLRRILGSCVILAGEETLAVIGPLMNIPQMRFLSDALGSGQSLVLL